MDRPLRLGRLPLARSAPAAHEPAVERWAATALARPLFSAGRRPQQDGTAAAGLARLTAIIVAGGERRAIFAADGQKPTVVPEGAAVGGYKLLHITSDSVELGGASGTLTLHPQFPVAASPAPPPPRPASPPFAVYYDTEN